MPQTYNPTTKDGRAVAEDNELKVLMALKHFGHLRRQEVAMSCWPRSSANSAYAMAARTVKRMLKSGLILEKVNSLGGKSLILAAKGVTRLRDQDIAALEGYELAFDGPQFFHRLLGTNYLLERARVGDAVFGEYAILKGAAPIDKEYVRERFKKVPDGLIVRNGELEGYRSTDKVVDWVEVESAYKPYDEVKKALSLFRSTSQLTRNGGYYLGKLVFVYDSRQKHDRQILRHIKRFLVEFSATLDPEQVLREIILARCIVDAPFTWHGMEEATAAELLSAAGDLGPDIETTLPDSSY